MKKALLIALFAFCLKSATAQVSLGLKGGANVTNFSGGSFDDLDKKALVGFHAGAFLNFRLGAISLQPELLVSTGGAKFKDINNNDSSFRLTYVTLPVMVKVRTPGGFYFEAGPQVGMKVGENVSGTEVGDLAKNLDLAAGVGIGYQANGGFGIGARYLAGLSKVGDNTTELRDPDFKNSTIQVGISFLILGKR
jgi:hypothetical protein